MAWSEAWGDDASGRFFHPECITRKLFSFTSSLWRTNSLFKLCAHAANGIHGSQIHSSSYARARACMSVKSSVQQITNGVYRSFKVTDTYRPPPCSPLIVRWNYTRGMFAAFLTSQNCFGWNPGAFEVQREKLIKQQVNVNKAKETSSSCHCCVCVCVCACVCV